MSASDVASTVRFIGRLLIQEASSLYGVEEQVQGLQEELQFMQQYLQNADSRNEEPEVCALVRQVRQLAYDAEDVIDTYILKVQQSKSNWFMRFGSLMYKFSQVYKVRDQIQGIQTSLKRVNDKLNSHGVQRITNLERGLLSREGGYPKQRLRSYSHDDSDGEFVVGMDEDIQKLVDIVMGEGRTHLGVISIVGMGGCGKTTLARKLYNHPYVNECFDCSAWVCISKGWNAQHILSEILRKVGRLEQETVKLQTTLSEEELVDKLRSILQKKSYLVVLDDVWNREALEKILPALPRGGSINKGSKIIITTRNHDIINFRESHRDHVYIHEPKPLTEESSWTLFTKIALSHRKNYDEEGFKIVGKEMLRKCDGLPLAIVALAGILKTRERIGEWHQVAEAVRSRILEGRGGNMYGRVGELLALSYEDLPYDLKPCFLYLGVFPEDCPIPVGTLTRMWIAEGLISTEYGDMSVEDVALQRVEELSHRFMIQVVRTNFEGVIKAIRLHDLLRDLSVQKAKEHSFLQIYTPFGNSDSIHVSTVAIQPRRASLHSSTALPAHISHLRSLILLSRSSISHSSYSCEETLDFKIVSRNFELLRVLSIWGIKSVTGTLPTQIGCLIHLKYLSIRATNITTLPISIGHLRNLLTLDYRDIVFGNKLHEGNVKIKIPNVFQELVLLRHLFLPIECPWRVKKLNLSSMRNLRTLWGVRLDNNSHCLLTEIPKLSTTLKKLKIVVSNENELKAAFCCPSLVADVLCTFHCDLRGRLTLCNVQPIHLRRHLLKLTLIGEIHMKLSLLLPVNLVKLGLKDSIIKDDDSMAALGALAHLKRLRLSNAFAGATLSFNLGSFPQLEELDFENLPILDDWTIDKGAMPCLKKLEITRCWRLSNFPLGLNSVTTLKQLEFFDMPDSFSRQAIVSGWAPPKLRLPHNFASIIKHHNSPVDSSSIQKLYDQLTNGIFLDNNTKKYWVIKKHELSGSYVNCFIVYATCLCLIKDKKRTYKKMEDCSFVDCSAELESPKDGPKVRAAKLSSRSSVHYEVVGRFDRRDLSLGVIYEIVWDIMFIDFLVSSDRNFQGFLDGTKIYKDGSHQCLVEERDGARMIYTTLGKKEIHKEPIIGMEINEWIHIPGGVLESTDSVMEEMAELSFCYVAYDVGTTLLELLVKGFTIQPKL